ncbi:MAG TPA: cysteine desulfurase family protein [Rhizomicrobium sp.]|nr:cysteine desulfurase family protein [Rhizomicrobium sp.]
MHYLDHNASSPLRPEARAAMERALSIGGNPSSVHGAGRAARRLVEEAREQVAALMGVSSSNVVFTSGGTEANSLAMRGAIEGSLESGERITRLFVLAVEHESVHKTAASLEEHTPGLRLEVIPVTADGVADFARVSICEGKGRALVVMMAANNETGVVQPVDAPEGLLFVDAVQRPGRYENAGYVSLSAHKIGGPPGVGALVVRDGVPFVAQLVGGGQERGLRAGTENVAGIAGFGAAAAAWTTLSSDLRDRFEAGLPASAVVFGKRAQRLPNTSNFALPGIAAETSLMALDLDGVMVSSGAACSSGNVKESHVLKAMGVSDDLARCALRVSFGWNSTEDDVDATLASIGRLMARREAA